MPRRSGRSGPPRGKDDREPRRAARGPQKDQGPRRAAGRPQKQAGGEPVRLQVYLARSGVASRRASEELISEGRVRVNGRPVTEPGTKVTPGKDRVVVDGKPVEPRKLVWVALHKPRGYVTTRDDPSDRRTVYDLLPPELHHLFHVGRLDRQSEGLLLLTNEGEAANRLLHPRYGIDKEYVATIEGDLTLEVLDRLVEGVEVEGEVLVADSVEVLAATDRDHTRLRLVLREGRYREVRRMLEAVGHPVTKLVRKRFGPIKLGKLRRGEWRELDADELNVLRRAPRR
jgi:23S rRNA pseudouridine2605 synthase